MAEVSEIMRKFTHYFSFPQNNQQMGNTIYTIFLFGLPLLVCFILWRALMAIIKRFWPRAAAIEKPGCLNLLIFIALGAACFGMATIINDNFATVITIKRNNKGKIVKSRTHHFAPGMKINGEEVAQTRLVNDSDVPVYVYSVAYGKIDPAYATTGIPAYTVTCIPGQTIPLMMNIDYFFKPAPESIDIRGDEEMQMRWVLDTIVPVDYVVPVAPSAPLITNPE